METFDMDYKEKFGDSVLKTICGLANTKGGKVIVGITDNGKIKGIKITNKELEKISEKIADKLGIHPQIEIQDKEGKKILIITISKSQIPISFNGKYYERVGNTTREMKKERLKAFFLKDTNWDSLINEKAGFDEIDNETVRLFIKMGKQKGRLTAFDENIDIKTLFEHLSLSENGKLTNGAIILFGTNPQKYFLNAALRVIRLKNEIIPIGDRLIKGNLFKQVFEGEEAIKNFINVTYEFKKLVREEIWDYPLPAIREALVNALIHRNYFSWNVQTQVKIFDDLIWFYNIGKLPEGITLKQLKEPHASVPRNPLIAHIFYLAGLIEEMGTGTGRIIQNFKLHNLPEPEFKEEMNGFSIYFRKDIYTIEYLKKLELNERQIKAVQYLKEKNRITNKEYQNIANTTKRTASRDLKFLTERGIIEQIGNTGKGTYYVLKRRGQKRDKRDKKET